MRIYLAAAIALGLLAGCSSEQDSPDSRTATGADMASRAGTTLPFVARSMTTSFASLPDRGELLDYQQGRPVKHSGAFTAYPVALSEAHALNAIRTGEMVVKAPNGELIRLQYERFVEHLDGNWSWIGRNADGGDAVLTFGEKAVFGTVPQGSSDTLRLTMSGGQSWLVATDRSKLKGAPPMDGPDHLVPPKLAAGTASGNGVGTASMRAESATATAVPTIPIDVLIGYTNGLAAQLGSQSAAVTRANNLVVITNQAYENSGVNKRVRLVGAMQVSYPDNTDNGEALEQMTGYTAGEDGGEIDPDPAFDALRAKRDELGADLVSLVRAFRTPENNGCGIAWLIGGGQTGIVQADAPFGYSVVSDGVDLDEGDGNDYFCREETLAHEMGHNMGQAHNKSDSDDTGVHAYSYGYREASSTGFYTVMAYPLTDSDQSAIRYFANPNVEVNGRPTGVANQSDNVRSMNITMPLVATFRATVIPIEGEQFLSRSGHIADFNGDGKSDILWRNLTTGANTIWRSGNKADWQSVASVTDLDWKIAGVGDFDGDGKSDILWRNTVTGANAIWKSGNKATWQSVASVTDVDWKVVGVDDFNGDGKSDILWRNTMTGANSIWRSGNKATWQSVVSVADLDWLMVGASDFNGDGKSDLLWRNSSTGVNVIWRSADKADPQSVSRVSDAEWLVSGVGDYNGDNKADVLWRNDTSGGNAIWSSANKDMYQPMASVTNDGWIIAGASNGDFNGDGRSDVLWRNSVNGTNVIWMSADKTAAQILSSVTDTDWSVMP